MKLNFKKSPGEEEFKYKEELKSELKNNSIVLSFALSIIVIGIFSIFYKNSTSLLIGIALSSLLLTIIQCVSNGNTMYNILPIFTMLIFGFFQKSLENIPVINVLLKEQYTNFIIFIAFSLTFLTQAYKNIVFNHKTKEQLINYNLEKNKLIYAQLEVIKTIKDKTNKIISLVDNKNITQKELKQELEELEEYVEDQAFVSNVKSSLIVKGSEENKSTFNIEEVEESIKLNSSIVKNRKINATTSSEKK